MTFSGQDPRQRNVEDTDAFSAIVSGGLNTNGNRLLMSGDDSPDCYNVEVKASGSLAKRQGFKLEYSFSADSTVGSVVVPWRSVFGYQFYICKISDDLQLLFKDSAGTWQGITKALVFPLNMQTKRPDFVVLSEPNRTRIVYVAETMVPIQLSLMEYQET